MRKIGTLKGIPVVEGNVNEVTKNQIHYKEEEGGIQLSKRSNDNKLNSITSGSSEGGGAKEYYYKWKDGADKFSESLELIGQIGRVKNIINVGRLTYNLVGYYDGIDLNNKDLMRNSDAFCIFGEETPLVAPGNKYLIVPKGNLIDKINVLNVIYPSEDASQIIPLVIDYINNNLTEITKEEYESMITYKPE